MISFYRIVKTISLETFFKTSLIQKFFKFNVAILLQVYYLLTMSNEKHVVQLFTLGYNIIW